MQSENIFDLKYTDVPLDVLDMVKCPFKNVVPTKFEAIICI